MVFKPLAHPPTFYLSNQAGEAKAKRWNDQGKLAASALVKLCMALLSTLLYRSDNDHFVEATGFADRVLPILEQLGVRVSSSVNAIFVRMLGSSFKDWRVQGARVASMEQPLPIRPIARAPPWKSCVP